MKTTDRLLLDTDIVIHLLKKQLNTVRRFLELKELTVEFLLSPIVVAEVYAGAFEREFAQIEIFFGFCRQLTLDQDTARLAGRYANKYQKAFKGISLEDYLVPERNPVSGRLLSRIKLRTALPQTDFYFSIGKHIYTDYDVACFDSFSQ
jgi:predicted nucleic acid-binding protein